MKTGAVASFIEPLRGDALVEAIVGALERSLVPVERQLDCDWLARLVCIAVST